MLTKYKIVPFCPYHFVHTILSNTILSVPFCPYHLVQYHFVRIPICPYHFVRTILSATIFVRSPENRLCSKRWYHDNSSTDISSTTLRLQTFRLQIFRLL